MVEPLPQSQGGTPGLHRSRRRTFLRRAAWLALGTGVYTWRIEPHWVETVRRPLPIPGLPAELEGRQLVQLSDLHIGPQVSDSYLMSQFRAVAALQPDIVVLTGDFISFRDLDQFGQIQRVLQAFPRGRLATLGILGNHDYGHGWRMDSVADRIERLAQEAGVDLLRNRIRTVAGLQVAGMDDLWSSRFEAGRVVSRLDLRRARLVLCHNPDAVDLPIWGDYTGWILSGHTHGGQCKPPFLPPPIMPVRNLAYAAGEYDVGEGRRLYINRGLGHLLRVRFNVRPEITVFTLTRGA